jgi:hypothetical protein
VLLFGHIGFGHRLISPWRRTMSFLTLTVGMLLPDVVDKPLYYAFHGRGVITSTRTFGHSGVAVLLLWLIARRNRRWFPIAAGATTHVLLDALMDVALRDNEGAGSEWIALVWPLRGFGFDTTHAYTTLTGHVSALVVSWPVVLTELVGLALSLWAFSRRRDYGRP